VTCPRCSRTERQIRTETEAGATIFECQFCLFRYNEETPQPEGLLEIRKQVLDLAAGGLAPAAIARQLGLSVRSVMHWVRRASEQGDGNGDGVTSGGRRRRPTIDDVAVNAGVSIATVSNYLNGKGRMRESTRERIRMAMDLLQFAPNQLARAIREGRSNIVGVLTFGLNNLNDPGGDSITPPMLQGLIDRADTLGVEVLIYTGWPQNFQRYSSLTFLSGHVDGLIWMAPTIEEAMLKRLAFAGLPVVALLARSVPDGVGYSCCDNERGMRDLMKHLMDLGHRRIALACCPYTSDFRDRTAGYRNALAEFGLPYDPTLVADNGWFARDYAEVFDRWLALPDRPTAIMTSDDSLALDTIAYFRSRGLRIPEDMAVTGFNGQGGPHSFITTIRQPFTRIAEAGMEMLAALIDGASVEQCRRLLPGDLVVSSSTVPISAS